MVLLSGQKKSRVTPHLLARHGGTEMWVTLDTITTVLIFEYERKFFLQFLIVIGIITGWPEIS